MSLQVVGRRDRALGDLASRYRYYGIDDRAASSACTAKMSVTSRSKLPDQTCWPLLPSMSRALSFRRCPSRRTLPSSTVVTPSRSATSLASSPDP